MVKRGRPAVVEQRGPLTRAQRVFVGGDGVEEHAEPAQGPVVRCTVHGGSGPGSHGAGYATPASSRTRAPGEGATSQRRTPRLSAVPGRQRTIRHPPNPAPVSRAP